MNELSTVAGVKVIYQPSEIKIEQEEKLNAIVEATAEKYKSLVFTEENVGEAMEARKELNSLVKMLDDQRKEVKRNYSKPLAEFENKLNKLTKSIKDVSNDINVVVKNYEDKLKPERQSFLEAEIKKMAFPLDVSPELIEIAPNWLNKGSFTGTGNLVKKVKDEVQSAIDAVVSERERIETDKKTIAAFAKANGLEVDGWVAQVDAGATAAELFPVIETTAKQKAEREAEEERKAKAQAEYDKAIAKMEQENLKEQDGKVIDTETGEIMDHEELVPIARETVVFEAPEERVSFTLKLTGSRSKMKELKQFIFDNGIEAVQVEA